MLFVSALAINELGKIHITTLVVLLIFYLVPVIENFKISQTDLTLQYWL